MIVLESVNVPFFHHREIDVHASALVFQQVNFMVGAVYDAIWLYGMAVNETLAMNGNLTDGRTFSRRMWNRKFNGEVVRS